MLESAKSSEELVQAYKKERSPYENLAPTTLPIDTLKTLERELQKRWSSASNEFYPLWFHAENERNVYLWRRSLSLSDAERFDFWVDVPALITKRETSLANPDLRNPFTNPRWDSDAPSDTGSLLEKRYLSDVAGAVQSIVRHAHALSVAGRMLIKTTSSDLVVLPAHTLLP